MKKLILARHEFLYSASLCAFLFFVQEFQPNNLCHSRDFQQSVEGRWDITIDMGGKSPPSWLEIHRSGSKTLVGQFVGAGGSARPISKINFADGKMSFSIPPQWEPGNNDITFEATLAGDGLTGTMTTGSGKTYNWTAVRAPSLKRANTPSWGKPIRLFNGKDLTGWHTSGENQWKAENGILQSPKSGSNLISDQKFTDFKLHVEFRYPKGSNSGVYLRGRYEVQIENDENPEPPNDVIGSIYGFLAPSEAVARTPGQWQSYDITLVGRMVTIAANGKTIICNREIPGITGGALDSNEAEPGPIYFQGDHGPIDYRNIIITPAKP